MLDIDEEDKEALKALYEKLSVDDLLLIEKYINIRANRRARSVLIDVERLTSVMLSTVRRYKGIL